MRIPWREASRFCWKHFYLIFASICACAILAIGAIAYRDLGATPTFEQKAAIVNNVLVAAGLLSIVLLIWQQRSTSSWNRVLSYHQYFGELPSLAKVDDLRKCLRRLKIDAPEGGVVLSATQAQEIWNDDVDDEKSAKHIVREYLNDFEEFCGAIRAGVVNESYARELEGNRTINAYFAFEEFIDLTRHEAEKIIADERDANHAISNVHRKPYHELMTVAQAWRKKRETEYSKMQKKKEKLDAAAQRDRNLDGVPPGGM